VLVRVRIFWLQQTFSLLQQCFSEFNGNRTTVPIIRSTNTGNIMKIQSILIAAIVAVAIPATTLADSGFFVAGSIGSAKFSENLDELVFDADSTSFRINAGWRFNDYFAFEGGYHNFGSFDQSYMIEDEVVDVSLKADGFTLGFVGNLPLGDRWSLFGRTGAYFWDGDADINNVTAESPGDTNLYFGAGVKFALNENLSLTADGTRYDLDGASSNVFSVGLNFNF
jgi:OOP family OmpA-OmpF porin